MTTETVTLTKPLKTHSGEVSSIELKETTAKSFFDHGEPFKVRIESGDVGDRIEFDFNNKIMVKFLSDMTGIDDIVLSALHTSDYMTLRFRAAMKIIEVAGTNPTAT